MIVIVVTMDLRFINEDEDEDEVISSLNDTIDLVMPATKASIEALKRAKFEDVDSTHKCMICLEELSKEFEVSRMSCFHVYHKDCIVQWLEKCSYMFFFFLFSLPFISIYFKDYIHTKI